MTDDDRSVLLELDSATLAGLGVSTPIVALDLAQAKQHAIRLGNRHALREFAWTPETAWAALPSTAAALRAAGVAGICCRSVAAAQAARRAGFRAVTLKLPPVTGAGPRQTAELAGRVELTAIVDHFAQAERLSDACRYAGTNLDLLLRVDVGRERLGVRPGPDLHDLALGVAALPAVRLAGIAVEAVSVASYGIAGLKPAELHRLLERCRRCLGKGGLAPHIVSVHRIDDVTPETADGEFHAAPSHTAAVATESRTPWPDPGNEGISIVAGVIGRPTRHAIIVDAGRTLLAERAMVIWPPDVRVETVTIQNDFSILKLADGGRSLVIGDLVVLETATTLAPPAGPVLIGNGRHWWIERVAPSEILP